MKASSNRGCWHVEHDGNLGGRQSFPCDQPDDLGVRRLQRAQSLTEGIVHDRRFNRIRNGTFEELCQAFGQSLSPLLAPPSIGNHSAGYAEQPQARFVACGNFIDTSPRHQHRFGNDISGVGG
jgi:hypothetical protein